MEGIVGSCDLRVTATSRGWLRMLRKEATVARLFREIMTDSFSTEFTITNEQE
jgi:hypothetical protein